MAQLEKEEKTREQLSSLDQCLSNVVFVVQTVRGEHLVEHISRLSKAVLNALPSPLATRHCAQLWRVMAHSVFKEWSLGMCTISLSPWNSCHFTMIILLLFSSLQLNCFQKLVSAPSSPTLLLPLLPSPSCCQLWSSTPPPPPLSQMPHTPSHFHSSAPSWSR